MASSTAIPDEAKELALIEKLRGQIVLAASDEKLSTVLEKFLAPLLVKCKSPHAKVVHTVRTLCDHTRERVAPESVRLPVAALLKQWQANLAEEMDNPQSASGGGLGFNQLKMIRFYDLRFIKIGIRRLSRTAQSELLPMLLSGLAKTIAYAPSEAAEIFHLLLFVLQQCQFPETGKEDNANFRRTLQLGDDDAHAAAAWFAKLMLFRSATNVAQSLTKAEVDFLNPPQIPGAWDPSTELGLTLGSTRKDVLNFLATGAFTDRERFFPALIASGDSIPYVGEKGEQILKRHVAQEVYDDLNTVKGMYALYFGSHSSDSTAGTPISVKTKVLAHLTKSDKSAQFTEDFARLITEGLDDASNQEVIPAGDKRQKGGLEKTKFRTAVFSFADFFIRRAEKPKLMGIVQSLVSSLKGFLELQGWPMPTAGQDLTLRQNAYELLGFLAQATKFYDFGMVEWFFNSLEGDLSSKEVGLSIEQGLSNLIGVFAMSATGTADESALTDLLYRFITATTNPESSRRICYAAVRFANRCLPFSNIRARQIDIHAMTGQFQDNREILEEGQRGLDPWWFKMLNSEHPQLWQRSSENSAEAPFQFPDFDGLLQALFDIRLTSTVSDDDLATARSQLLQKIGSNGPYTLVAIDFCRLMFLEQALHPRRQISQLDADWRRKLLTRIDSDNKGRSMTKEHIKMMDSDRQMGFDLLLQAALAVLDSEHVAQVPDCETMFVNLLSVCPASFLERFRYGKLHQQPIRSLKSNNAKVRIAAARSFGILFAVNQMQESAALDAFDSLLAIAEKWNTAVGGQVNEVHGAVEALGYATARLMLTSGNGEGSTTTKRIHEMKLSSLAETLTAILLGSGDNTLLEAACDAIGQVSIFADFSRIIASDSANKQESIIKKLSSLANAGKTFAITALGRVSVSLSEDSQSEILEVLYSDIVKLHDLRQIEQQFDVGEALACLAGSWQCSVLQLELDIDGFKPAPVARAKTLVKILDETIKNCKNPKPKLRKAAVIWLLSLIQMLGHTTEVQSQLRLCQAAFKHCLTDRDELVQEAASRGLGLVYEQGDRDLKDTLVKDLVGSFTENKARLAGNVTEDTQLFEEGALPTGDGSVTTYKDILSLAAEVGNPSLVYRFMSLAANNSIWTSRAAFGRFGLSNIFSDSAVDGYLAQNPKLYPKLYRYQFDPNTNVQRSMKDIWSALVKDTNKTLDQHFDAIMADLLESILTKEWRVREASCAAVADLIQGRRFEKYEPFLTDIWKKCFLVLDDIKGSVQKAAVGLARVLSNLLIRSLEAGDSSVKGSTKMLQNVLPFLRSNSGLGSSAQQVRLFASSILTDIVKKGSAKVLRPFIADIIDLLISQLSEAELEGIEYFRMRASEYKLTGQDIDDIRVKVLKRHPIMESLERSLELVDEDSIEEMVKALENSIKTAIALPSKVGCSTVLVSMSTRHRLLFKPYAGRFLKLIEKAVTDRNDTVSNAYANAAGYLCRLASDDEILRAVEFAKKLYTTAEDERNRAIAAEIVHAISKYATDRFNSLSSDFLPFIFVAKHDSSEDVRKIFANTWDDNVGGSRAVFLYLKEIISLASSYLDSPKWSMKHTAARAIADAATLAASQLDDMSTQQAEIIWPALEKSAAGKSWEGKEVVILAFAKFVAKAKPFWRGNPKVAAEVRKIIIREARRQNKGYQEHALIALSDVADARDDIDMSEDVFDTVQPLVEELTNSDSDAMDIDAGEGKKDDALRDRILVGAVSAAQASLHLGRLSQKDAETRIHQFLAISVRANTVQQVAVSLAVFKHLGLFFDKLAKHNVGVMGKDEATSVSQVETVLFKPIYNSYSEATRDERAKAILSLAKSGWKNGAEQVLKTSLSAELENERATVVREKLQEARSLVG